MIKKHKTVALKCCPLCGGAAEFFVDRSSQSDDEIGVFCTKCGLMLREPNDEDFYVASHNEDGTLDVKAEKMIASLWNKRYGD